MTMITMKIHMMKELAVTIVNDSCARVHQSDDRSFILLSLDVTNAQVVENYNVI